MKDIVNDHTLLTINHRYLERLSLTTWNALLSKTKATPSPDFNSYTLPDILY